MVASKTRDTNPVETFMRENRTYTPETTNVSNIVFKDNSTRTYEIITNAGSIRMDIPESWKVTYGPVSPGSKYGGGEGNALRVYEGTDKQRAIFLNVKSFRDLSIPIMRLYVKSEGKDEWERDTEGNSSNKSKTNVTREWRVDED